MVRRTLGAAFDVIDPCGLEVGSQLDVRGEDVDAHAEVAHVVHPVVSPREATLVCAPMGCIEIDEAFGEDCCECISFARGYMGEPDERVRVEDVAVIGRDVEVATNHEMSVGEPQCDALTKRFEEGELELEVPMTYLATVWDVHAGEPDRTEFTVDYG